MAGSKTGRVTRHQARSETAAGTNLTNKEFELFRSLIHARCGIYLGEDKKDLVRNRFSKRLRKGGFTSYRDYYEYVVNDQTGQELVQLINMISTNLTYFFREPQHFDYLTGQALPPILNSKTRQGRRRLRIWSAACSTGEEVYSLAMTVSDLLNGNGSWDFKILGTDISTKVLAVAKAGRYNLDQTRNLDVKARSDYLNLVGNRISMAPEIRRLATFARINLLDEYPFKGPFDVIFCRNVMIYFDQQTRERLVNRFWKYLASGGYLFIGLSENLTGLNHRFEYASPAVYRK